MRRIRKGRPAASRPAHEAYHRAALTAGASLSGKGHLWPLGGHLSGKPRLILVHGTPTLNTLYWTEDRPDSFFRQMAEIAGMRAGDTIAFGHTHRPWFREIGGMHFLNTGSVGKPKDGDWRACYVCLEIGGAEPQATFVRVEYDIERATKAIRESELPSEFAEALRTGGSRGPAVEYTTVEPGAKP